MKIVLAGVVGVGKSTISDKLAQKLNFKVMQEPVADNPYLDDFYGNPKEFAFKMQIFMLMARSKQLKAAIDEENVIFDRSILEDPIFVEVLKAQNNISDVDYQVYYDFYNHVVVSSLYFDPKIKPDLIVYLQVTTDNAIKRIVQRGRESEKHVDSGYWELLNQKYQEWYQKNKDKFPFLVVDTNSKNPDEIVEEIITTIKNSSS
ncbi:deoxynucleoside kinase [Spiroplasma platyhelix]|uniref:Deoxynucleoside kinase n=1 Tax=Spiroplasma platyhelix PALS-1 TaxID=1276218 RepID=A0A846TSQ2_9MOLU|nr:deoxynucleoside kinase [Spiroplasma platyhelix]MBE4704164.1 Deoxyadenosine/deoxycytidine kinase [Spiroplasma platyhelix PALS-1]NKE38535.1 deoxynucleoside kinase [Spiroplasma platyhelix PALS-1]UJB29422.1 deoxyadenosine/deoxycytidine kinase [Spiroplasma platyhelix PALS-1]